MNQAQDTRLRFDRGQKEIVVYGHEIQWQTIYSRAQEYSAQLEQIAYPEVAVARRFGDRIVFELNDGWNLRFQPVWGRAVNKWIPAPVQGDAAPARDDDGNN